MAPASGLPAYTMPPAVGAWPGDGNAAASAPTSAAPLYRGAQYGSTGTAGDAAPARTSVPAGTPAPSGNRPSGTYGVGASGGVRQPFGASPAQVSAPPVPPQAHGGLPQSHGGLPQAHGGVPQQRVEGTVYGGRPAPETAVPVPSGPADMTMPVPRPADMTMPVAGNPADMTMPVPMNFNAALENSGSLTGHILAQGWDRGVDTNRRSNVKVGIAMLLVLVFLVGVSVLFLFTAGDAFTDMLDGVFGTK